MHLINPASDASETVAFASSTPNLPVELLEQVLNEPSLSKADPSAFSLASHAFLTVARPKLWRSASLAVTSPWEYRIVWPSNGWLVLHPDDAARSAFFRQNPSLAACVRQLTFAVTRCNPAAEDGRKWQEYALPGGGPLAGFLAGDMVELLVQCPESHRHIDEFVQAWGDAQHGTYTRWATDLHEPLSQMSHDADVWLRRSLALFPNLDYLVLTGFHFAIASVFSSPHLPCLRYLTLVFSGNSRPSFASDLVAALTRLPSLVSLTMPSYSVEPTGAFSFAAPVSSPPAFRTLSLPYLGLARPDLAPLLAWTTSNSESSLQGLSLPYPIDLRAHFPRHAFLSLRTLDLFACSHTWYDPAAAHNFASVFPAVEDLRVTETFPTRKTPPPTSLTQTLLPLLPSSLKHLRLPLTVFRPSIFLALFSDSTCLPALQYLKLTLGKMYLATAWADEGIQRKVVEGGAARDVRVVIKL